MRGGASRIINQLRGANLRRGTFKYTTLVPQTAGPLPIVGANLVKERDDTTILWWFTGSGFISVAGNMFVTLDVGGAPLMSMRVYSNEINSHKAMIPRWHIETDRDAGSYSVQVSANTGSFDLNDFFEVVAIEFARP